MAMTAERKAERKAQRDYQKRMNKLQSIAHKVVVRGDELSVLIDGVVIQGNGPEKFNNILERLGYRPVRITRNMLNPDSQDFAIDINTPSYCDPGCESYHSM